MISIFSINISGKKKHVELYTHFIIYNGNYFCVYAVNYFQVFIYEYHNIIPYLSILEEW